MSLKPRATNSSGICKQATKHKYAATLPLANEWGIDQDNQFVDRARSFSTQAELFFGNMFEIDTERCVRTWSLARQLINEQAQIACIYASPLITKHRDNALAARQRLHSTHLDMLRSMKRTSQFRRYKHIRARHTTGSLMKGISDFHLVEVYRCTVEQSISHG